MKISIVIPLYNKEKHILDTLDCISKQTYQEYEILVVNDGSTDDSLKKVESYKDARLKIINQTNSGAAAARNRGVKEATSEYIAFMDADDFWEEQYLELMVQLINEYPDACIYGSNYKIIEDGQCNVLNFPGIKNEKGYIDNYFVSGKVYTPLWTSAVIVKKATFLNLGGFPTTCKVCEDIDLWCRFAATGKVAYINKPLATYVRDSSNMLSRSKEVSYDFPFLKEFKKVVNQTDVRISDVEEYVRYRTFVAISNALLIANNKKEAKRLLNYIGYPKEYLLKAFGYRIFLYLPNCVIKKYCDFRIKIARLKK